MRDGHLFGGWGMASSIWGVQQMPASARITFRADGTAGVTSATSDIGPGTYTVMTMIAAEFLGLRLDQVQFEPGDTRQPKAPAQGGSWTTSSVGSAVRGAALTIVAKLLDLANQDAGSPLRGAVAADVEKLGGRLLTSSVGKRMGQTGFSSAADVDQSGIVDIRGISAISRLLPVGTRC